MTTESEKIALKRLLNVEGKEPGSLSKLELAVKQTGIASLLKYGASKGNADLIEACYQVAQEYDFRKGYGPAPTMGCHELSFNTSQRVLEVAQFFRNGGVVGSIVMNDARTSIYDRIDPELVAQCQVVGCGKHVCGFAYDEKRKRQVKLCSSHLDEAKTEKPWLVVDASQKLVLDEAGNYGSCQICGGNLNENVDSGKTCIGCSESLEACETEEERQDFIAGRMGKFVLKRYNVSNDQLAIYIGKLLQQAGVNPFGGA